VHQEFLEGTRHKKDVARKKRHEPVQTRFHHGISAFPSLGFGIRTEIELPKVNRSQIGLVAKYTGRACGERQYVGAVGQQRVTIRMPPYSFVPVARIHVGHNFVEHLFWRRLTLIFQPRRGFV
jgi:hypothetical protein